jgi:type I restriction enzyme M protein
MFFERSGPTKAIWYYEMPLPEGLKKFSKGNPILDENFTDAEERWQVWQHNQALIAKELPQLEKEWQEWNKLRLGKGDVPLFSKNAWVVPMEEIKRRGYDLSVRNPHQSGTDDLPKPTELTARLLERVRELHDIIEGLHEKVGNGEE